MKTDTPLAALLLIADISGYTSFMRLHALTNSHARQIIARLLRALLEAARPPLRVAELEGDAVFFYAVAPNEDLEKVAAQVKDQILRFYQVFDREIEALSKVKACVCEACRTVEQLKIKQVVHCGEITIEKIDRFEKLFGIDVILVHRMLKNTVPSREYLMMTVPAHTACADFYAPDPEPRIEDFEGIGEVETLVYYKPQLIPYLSNLPERSPVPSLGALVAWKLKMHARTLRSLLGRSTEVGPGLTT